MRITRSWLVLFLLGALLLGAAPAANPAGAARPHLAAARYYSETGYTLDTAFVTFYDAHGGLPVFGYPIGAAHDEGGYLVQYCERERLEYHPEYAGTPFAVLLGRLGAGLTAGRTDGPFAPLAAAPAARADGAGLPGDALFLPATGHLLQGPFLDYWRANGDLTLFGYPISEEFVENGLRQQWFERARLEYHPELPDPFRVALGLLGREALAAQQELPGQVTIAAGPPTPRHLQLGLAQGGESPDPAFFDNVVPLIGTLHVSLIRLDNVYTSYNVVARDAAGRLTFDWTALDAVVADIAAMGAQPLFCLSYTPGPLSPDGSRIQPPASLPEWAQLVQATVAHYNRPGQPGIHYWEVWNEPDQGDLWRGSWPDYLRLYDVTRQAILAVDSGAHVGGPARSVFDAGALSWFLGHEQQQGPEGGAEFVSWHAYGLLPATVADQVGTARNIVAAYPGVHPELAITEFNVTTGGPNDTSLDGSSDTSAGAAYVLGLLARLDQAGLDRAFLFEVKDGASPAAAFWGRWGITTYDGRPKPVYHALQAYQDLGPDLLPAGVSGPAGLGALAATPAGRPHILLWNSGTATTHVRVAVPPAWSSGTFAATLFDAAHNNPRASGDAAILPFGQRGADGLVFDLAPGSFVVMIGE